MKEFTIDDIRGVIPAMVTSFDKYEDLDETSTRNVARFLSSFDIGGLYLTGSTGEAFLMKPRERRRALEVVIDEVGKETPIIAHIGALSTKISIELVEHAEKVGATAISSVPPFYWHFTEDQIYNYYADIAKATSLPMIVYNIHWLG